MDQILSSNFLLCKLPHRVQRLRKRGWRMPPNTVYVGRPTKWGNLWTVGLQSCGCRSAGECDHNLFACETAEEAVDLYRRWITGELFGTLSSKRLREAHAELKGKNLACWCPLDKPCHADVLLKLANETAAQL